MKLKALIWDAIEEIDSFWSIKDEMQDKLDKLDKRLYELEQKLCELDKAMQKKELEEGIK